MNLGHRYMEEGNYEQAALTFDKAIAIDDRCIESYAGGIKSYQLLGDKGGLTNIYERALEAVAGLDEGELSKSMEAVVEIYLAADDVYSDNLEKVIQVLEDGQELTGAGRIKDRLVEDYLDPAADENRAFIQKVYDLMAAGDYEAMQEVYGSEESRAFVDRMDGDFYIYVPGENGSQTGTGFGVYKYGEGGYYFYYGASLTAAGREAAVLLFLLTLTAAGKEAAKFGLIILTGDIRCLPASGRMMHQN